MITGNPRDARAAPLAGTRHSQGSTVVLIFEILRTFLWIMSWAIIIRALLSWFDPRGSNPVSRFLIEFTEPVVAPIRSIMPRTGFIDLSPLIAIIVIQVLIRMLDQAVNT
jgi:YggT family protein